MVKAIKLHKQTFCTSQSTNAVLVCPVTRSGLKPWLSFIFGTLQTDANSQFGIKMSLVDSALEILEVPSFKKAEGFFPPVFSNISLKYQRTSTCPWISRPKSLSQCKEESWNLTSS